MQKVASDFDTMVIANGELKGTTVFGGTEAETTRALPHFHKLVQYGDHFFEKSGDNTSAFVDTLQDAEQRTQGRSFLDTMKHEQASEEAKQKEVNPDHGKLTFEDRILLVTSKHEALEATKKKDLSLAGMATAPAKGREGRSAKAWDINANHDRGGRRNR